MLGNKREEGTGFSPRTLLTGPQQVKFLAVNPDSAKLEQIYGKEQTREPNYDLVDKNGKTYRPCVFYFQETSTGTIVNLRVNIGELETTPMDSEGNPRNYKILTSTGNVTWAGKKEDGVLNIKPQFEDLTPLRNGEDTVIAFVQALTDFNYKSGQDYPVLTSELGLTAKDLYEGKYDGFNNLTVEYPLNTFICMFVVSASLDTPPKFYQNISSNPETFFADKYGSGAGEFHTKRLKDRHANSLVGGRDMFQGFYYSFEPQAFTVENSLGGVPNNPSTPQTASWND